MVAGVCKRLEWVARNVFSSKWKELHFTINDMADTASAIDYLRKFGAEVRTLRLMTTQKLQPAAYNILLIVMVQYCGGSLSRLELHGFALDGRESAIEEVRPLLARVQHLILNGCDTSVKWLVSCPELVELDLNDTNVTFKGAQNQACPKLKVLKIKGAHNWVKKGLHLFLEQNRQLKTFESLPIPHRTRDLATYERILDFVPASIECLATIPLGFTKSIRFTTLKTVRIFGARKMDIELMNRCMNTDKIEYLCIDLNHPGMNGGIGDEISKLRNLKTLSLRCDVYLRNNLVNMITKLTELAEFVLSTEDYYFDELDVLRLIQHGPNLQRLILSFRNYAHYHNHHFKMNAETYRKMLNIIAERSNGMSLHIVIIIYQRYNPHVNLNFPMQKYLKITCLTFESVAKLSNVDYVAFLLGRIHMTEDVLKMLSDQGLCK